MKIIIDISVEELKELLSEKPEEKNAGLTASQYARVIDSNNSILSKIMANDKTALKSIEQYLNNVLKRDGYLLLNDAYNELGIRMEPEYAKVGWSYANSEGDGYVDLGIRYLGDGTYLIDPNVDGKII